MTGTQSCCVSSTTWLLIIVVMGLVSCKQHVWDVKLKEKRGGSGWGQVKHHNTWLVGLCYHKIPSSAAFIHVYVKTVTSLPISPPGQSYVWWLKYVAQVNLNETIIINMLCTTTFLTLESCHTPSPPTLEAACHQIQTLTDYGCASLTTCCCSIKEDQQ